MHAIGPLQDETIGEVLLDDSDDLTYRARIVRGGGTTGVQTVGPAKIVRSSRER